MPEVPAAAAQDKACLKYNAGGGGFIRCMVCSEYVTKYASVTVHKCPALCLPCTSSGIVQEVLYSTSEGNQRCRLCCKLVSKTKEHVCKLDKLCVFVDALGVTSLADPYNNQSKSVQEAHQRLTAMARTRGRLFVSLVQLPDETPCKATSTVTYLADSTIPDSQSFERKADGTFISCGNTVGSVRMDGVRLVTATIINSDTAAQPRFAYHGAILADRADADVGLSAVTLSMGNRTFTIDQLLYGGVAYKLNHMCNARQLSMITVDVPRWECPMGVIQATSAQQLFKPHEELVWDYEASCDTEEEELLCFCCAKDCRRLLVSWQHRSHDEPVTVLVGGKNVAKSNTKWNRWVRSIRGQG